MKMLLEFPKERFSSLTFLDYNMSNALLERKAVVNLDDVNNIILGGNKGETIFPYIEHALIKKQNTTDYTNDRTWTYNEFVER